MSEPISSRPVIGLTGAIGSGKSLVSSILAELGAVIIDADRIGHQLLDRAEIMEALCSRFGADIVRGYGKVDRKLLGQRVFAAAESLAALNKVMHPPLECEIERQISEFRSGKAAAAVLDAAILFEANWDRFCDVVVYVEAPLEDRRRRVAQMRGWSPETLAERENLQKPLDFKRTKSDYVLCNNSSMSHLRQQVCLLYHRLVGPA